MKILVTGGNGMVGKSLKKIMPNAIYLSSKNYDLTSELEVIKMFEDIKPNVIVHLAAKVGGIIDNINKYLCSINNIRYANKIIKNIYRQNFAMFLFFLRGLELKI